MKKAIILTMAIISSGITGNTQTVNLDSTGSNKVKEPEYDDVFFVLDSASGNLIDLERQVLKVKIHPHGFGGSESDLQMKGGKSPVRFKQGQALEFVVHVSPPEMDPMGFVSLYSLESNKNDRRLEVRKAGYMDFKGQIVLDKSFVAINATRYGSSSFKIKTVHDLSPGEYLLLTKNAKEGFAFGID